MLLADTGISAISPISGPQQVKFKTLPRPMGRQSKYSLVAKSALQK